MEEGVGVSLIRPRPVEFRSFPPPRAGINIRTTTWRTGQVLLKLFKFRILLLKNINYCCLPPKNYNVIKLHWGAERSWAGYSVR